MSEGARVELLSWEAIRCGRICVGDSSPAAQKDKGAARSDGAEEFALEILRLRLRMTRGAARMDKRGGLEEQEGVVEGQA